MGRIITVASGKGGCSKTTAITVISATLAVLRYRVAVIDADPNASFFGWHKMYEGPVIECTTEIRQEEIVDHAQAQSERFDVVLIDTAGFNNTTAAMATGTADFVLIPLMPDRASAIEAMKMVRQTKSFSKASRREIPMACLRSRWNPRGLVERAVTSDLLSAGVPLIEQHLSDLSDFGKLSLTGKVPIAGKIGVQVQRIIDELIAHGAIPSKPARKAA